MSSAQLHKEDWRILQHVIAPALVMRGLSMNEFRDKLLCLEESGHIVFTVSDETMFVTGGLICGLPRWEMPRAIAFAGSGTLH
jgi:hypothetical protein